MERRYKFGQIVYVNQRPHRVCSIKELPGGMGHTYWLEDLETTVTFGISIQEVPKQDWLRPAIAGLAIGLALALLAACGHDHAAHGPRGPFAPDGPGEALTEAPTATPAPSAAPTCGPTVSPSPTPVPTPKSKAHCHGHPKKCRCKCGK